MTVYLDYNATSPVDRRVVDAMLPYFSERWGNPASRDHAFGWDAATVVEEARGHVAELINAGPEEIAFTASATEGIDYALKAVARAGKSHHMLTFTTEHESVLRTCRTLENSDGAHVDYLGVDRMGRVKTEAVVSCVDGGEPPFVSMMLANNEIGTVHSISTFADEIRSAGGVFFSDLTQAVGKIPVNVRALGVDLAAFSAHKICGPKGVGALFIRGGDMKLKIETLSPRGGQERGFRSGTLNVPGIVGFGEACRLLAQEFEGDVGRITRLRDHLEAGILTQVSHTWVNGDRGNRLCNTSNIGFKGIDARTMIRDMHDIAVSTRSACSSGNSGPSHVLKAIGLSDEDAYSCIRFSLGRYTTQDEIDYAIRKVVTSAHKLRRSKSA